MSSHRESVEDDIARLSADIFGDPMPPPNYPQNYPTNYPRRDQVLQTSIEQAPNRPNYPHDPFYISNNPNEFIPQLGMQPYPPYAYGATSSIASSHSADTMEIGGNPSRSAPEIQAADIPPSPSGPSGPSDSQQDQAGKKSKRQCDYNQPWTRYFKQTKNDEGTLVSLHCKVKGCKNPIFHYKQSSGMSSFKRHAQMHERKGEEPSETVPTRQIQTLMNADGTRTNPKYDEAKMLSEMARYITHKEQPISMGGCMSFARLVIRGCGQPMYKRIHHRKMVGEIKNQFTTTKNELRGIFAYQNNKVSITSDIWTAGKHGLGYSCITGHWIDDQWVLQKRILSFRVLDSPHTGNVIFKSIIDVLQEYNLKRDLDNKIFSISFDNASNNLASIEIFKRSLQPIMNGAMFHQKCACHILNLVVKAGLKTEAVKYLIIKFKNALSHIVSNQERKQRFAFMCEGNGLQRLRVPWDVDTRWNSTYRMLHRCLPYKAVVGEFLRCSTPEGMALDPTEGEWEQLQRLTDFLGTFFTATVALSCSYRPTSYELVKQLYSISKVYRALELAESHDKSLTPIVDAMKQKFLKYWEDVPLLAIIASCLNPAYKKYYTIRIVERYKENLHLDSTGVEAYVNSKFDEMFNLYNSRIVGTQNPSSSRGRLSSTSSRTSSAGLLADFQSESQPHTSTNELLSYMSMLNENEQGLDIPNWWKNNARGYPTLSMMARDVFAVPVSTVPSESCFSSANRILSDKRSKLGAHVFERLVCLKDWIDAENRQQHREQQESSSGVETEESGTEAVREPASDSDGAEENEQWYMDPNY